MSGNTTGSVFRVTTWGESHGRALGAVVDGCLPGIPLTESDIQQALDRRKPSASVASTTRKEGISWKSSPAFLRVKRSVRRSPSSSGMLTRNLLPMMH